MITIIKKNQSEKKERLLPDHESMGHCYKSLEKMIADDIELTELNAMRIYGEIDLRGRVAYLNKYKGYNIQRIRKRVGHGKGSHLIRWWEQIGEVGECT